MLLAEHAGMRRSLIRRLLPEGLAARGAGIEARQPARQPHRPEREVAQRQGPAVAPFDFPHGQQDQPEHRPDTSRSGRTCSRFRYQRQAGAEAVIALGLVEGFDSSACWMRTRSRVSRSIYQSCACESSSGRAVNGSSGGVRPRLHPACGPTNVPGNDQAIRLTQREVFQDDGFRFAGRHRCRAPTTNCGTGYLRPFARTWQDLLTYHTPGNIAMICKPMEWKQGPCPRIKRLGDTKQCRRAEQLRMEQRQQDANGPARGIPEAQAFEAEGFPCAGSVQMRWKASP